MLASWSGLIFHVPPGLIGPEHTGCPKLSKCTDWIVLVSFFQMTGKPIGESSVWGMNPCVVMVTIVPIANDELPLSGITLVLVLAPGLGWMVVALQFGGSAVEDVCVEDDDEPPHPARAATASTGMRIPGCRITDSGREGCRPT